MEISLDLNFFETLPLEIILIFCLYNNSTLKLITIMHYTICLIKFLCLLLFPYFAALSGQIDISGCTPVNNITGCQQPKVQPGSNCV